MPTNRKTTTYEDYADYRTQFGPKDPKANQYAHSMDAYERAEKYLAYVDKEAGIMPVGLYDMEGLENVDPAGCYGPYDLAYKKRLQDLEAVLPLLDPEAKKMVGNVLKELESSGKSTDHLKDRLKEECKNDRICTCAANMCLIEEGYNFWKNSRNEKRERVVNEVDGILNCVEYMAGTRKEPPTNQEMGHLNKYFKSLDRKKLDSLHAKQESRQVAPDGVKIPFANFDNTLKQQYYAHPSQWGDWASTPPEDYKNTEIARQAVERYATSSVSSVLDSMYGPSEDKFPHLSNVNRSKLILVEGKSVHEHMKDIYEKIEGKKSLV